MSFTQWSFHMMLEHNHHKGRHDDFLQGLGHGPARRLQPRLAAQCRRLGRPDGFGPPTAIAPLPMTVVAMADPASPGTATTWTHYADDLAALIDTLDLHDAVLVGHSTGGGEVARYIGRHGT